MVQALRRVEGQDVLTAFPNLAAYVERGKARPAFKRAFATQKDDYERTKDRSLVRRVIASAPGLARPYELLHGEGVTLLEQVAAAGMAALCRPASLEALETAADLLTENGRTDEGLRFLDRAVRLHG